MSPPTSPFVPRVFSQPTEADRARLARFSALVKEDTETRRLILGSVFTAPVRTADVGVLETGGESIARNNPHIDVENEMKEVRGTNLAFNQDASVVANERNENLNILSINHISAEQARVPESDAHVISTPTADDSDDELDQPGGFAFLAHIDIDTLDLSDENDTRSSGWTEPSPLRPRRLFANAANAIPPSGLREAITLWNDGEESTCDLSTIADFNDLSQYHGDLEDELDEEYDDDDDDDDDDSDYVYSSACSSLSSSSGSDDDDDDDFFDANSEAESDEEDL